MEVEFTPRGHRVGPGRRPKEAPPELLEMLRATYDQGTQANINVAGASRAEISEVVTMINNGAKGLGFRARVFGAKSGQTLRFWMEDITDE